MRTLYLSFDLRDDDPLMNYPARLSHLATRAVVAAKLAPTYGAAHQVDTEEALVRLDRALSGRLLEDVLTATWVAMKGKAKRITDEGLLEKVAQTLKERPLRLGRRFEPTPALSAFLLLADLEAGTASDAVRRVLETEEGRKRAAEGLAEVGRILATELTKGR